MEYYLNFSTGNKMSVSAEEPDKQADMTVTIRSGSSARIGEMLTTAKQYVSEHDVMLEGITGAFNKIAMGLRYKNLNATMVSSILERKRD